MYVPPILRDSPFRARKRVLILTYKTWQLPMLNMNISDSYAATILPLRVHADICGYPVDGSIIAFENVIYYWKQEKMGSCGALHRVENTTTVQSL